MALQIFPNFLANFKFLLQLKHCKRHCIQRNNSRLHTTKSTIKQVAHSKHQQNAAHHNNTSYNSWRRRRRDPSVSCPAGSVLCVRDVSSSPSRSRFEASDSLTIDINYSSATLNYWPTPGDTVLLYCRIIGSEVSRDSRSVVPRDSRPLSWLLVVICVLGRGSFSTLHSSRKPLKAYLLLFKINLLFINYYCAVLLYK